MKMIPISGKIASSSEFDDEGEALALVTTGKHCGHIVRISSAKNNCGNYAVSVACSCGSTWEQASGGCHIHRSYEMGDETLAEVAEEALHIPDYLWPEKEPPEWWVNWMARIGGVYNGYPEFLVAAISSMAADMASILDGLLDKRISSRQVRQIREDFQFAKIWRPEE